MIIKTEGIAGQFRHGDVLVERLGQRPAACPAVPAGNNEPPTLAEGEFSGHSHRVFGGAFGGAVMFRDDALARDMGDLAYVGTLVVTGDKVELRHVGKDNLPTGEHDTITLPPADYSVIVQREYDPEGERRAAD